jgi:hypothetical protein
VVDPAPHDDTLPRRCHEDAMTLEKLYEHGSFAIVAGIVQPLQITEFLLAGLRCELLGFLCIAIADDE